MEKFAQRRAEPERREPDKAELGSIAEAALKINGVFEAAQRAADYYLKSLHELYPLPEGVKLPPEPQGPGDKPVPAAGTEAAPAPSAAAVVRPAGTQPVKRAGPFGVKRQKGEGKGKTTLFFGWQHD